MDFSMDESKILVIYTGGTIGMLFGSDGYTPEPYYLTQFLRSQARFHDPLQDSLFSNSGSSHTYREWSGRNTPTNSTDAPRGPQHQPTLPVKSTRHTSTSNNLGLSESRNSTSHQLGSPPCVKLSENVYESQLPSLVTPRSQSGLGAKRIRYAILEWTPLMDSVDIEIEDWVRLSTEIELNYATFDAFVVLHGTDTMAYTASALSFMLEDLGKTVILTGAQIPLSQLRNDAAENLLGALVIAGQYTIPECTLYFNHTLYRGNRASKMSSADLGAFNSPNFPPLVDVGIDIVVNWTNVIRQTRLSRFKSHKMMSPHVATLRLFPGITAATVRAFLHPPIKAVVLETFGPGNAPQRADLLDALRTACDSGVIIVAITQCTKGSISDDYETGRTLRRAGVVSGGDMTPECALTKLSYLLSKTDLSASEIRELMGTPLRGELSRPSGLSTLGQPNMNDNIEQVQGLLLQMVRLSSTSSSLPSITVSSPAADDSIAPWSWTAADVVSTEAALLPYLVHIAAAKDDIDGISFGINSSGHRDNTVDVANCLGVSGRSPLHTAALHNSMECVDLLLKNGALVHLRDTLGHTALYYAARMGHKGVVDLLVRAGANLGGSDIEGGFVDLAVKKAGLISDQRAIDVWAQAGVNVPAEFSFKDHTGLESSLPPEMP